jgi:hypothetical protein
MKHKFFPLIVYPAVVGVSVYQDSMCPSPYGPWVDSAISISVGMAHLGILWMLNLKLRRAATAPMVELGLMLLVATSSMAVIFAFLKQSLPALFSEANFFHCVLSGSLLGCEMLGIFVLAVRAPEAMEQAHTLRLEAELQSLKARLEPHFLLNTINAIAGMVRERPTETRQALAALGDLLHDVLEKSDERWHRVSDEVEWLKSYVTLFQVRYGDQLSAEWNVDERIQDRKLPRLLIQPLVENAILHGASLALPGVLTISFAASASGSLVVEIRNTGPQLQQPLKEGQGLRLVRGRLALEAPRATFTLVSEASQTVARVTLS